jgi:response regulator RpfG family c-di-GMP phosphodiesterase
MTGTTTPRAALQGLHILLIEDSVEMVTNLSAFFRAQGARLVEAQPSALRAKKRLQSPPVPDIVLLDFRLNGSMTGTDLALWMREQPHLAQVLRVSFTAVAREHALRGAPDDRVYHAMLQKPVRLATLVEQMAALLRQPR